MAAVHIHTSMGYLYIPLVQVVFVQFVFFIQLVKSKLLINSITIIYKNSKAYLTSELTSL